MDTNQLIEQMGGRSKVIAETGLTKGRISQWAIDDSIPAPWLKYFKQKYKKLNWAEYRPAEGHDCRTKDKKH